MCTPPLLTCENANVAVAAASEGSLDGTRRGGRLPIAARKQRKNSEIRQQPLHMTNPFIAAVGCDPAGKAGYEKAGHVSGPFQQRLYLRGHWSSLDQDGSAQWLAGPSQPEGSPEAPVAPAKLARPGRGGPSTRAKSSRPGTPPRRDPSKISSRSNATCTCLGHVPFELDTRSNASTLVECQSLVVVTPA